MPESTMWWVMAGIAVVLELFTGTFYLLMLSLGLAAGALAALAGAGTAAQLVVAAVVGGGAALALYWLRRRRPGAPSARADRSVNLDVDAIVQIDHWSPDGTAQVRYRGAPWTARLRPGSPARAGAYRVVELIGSQLLVEPADAA